MAPAPARRDPVTAAAVPKLPLSWSTGRRLAGSLAVLLILASGAPVIAEELREPLDEATTRFSGDRRRLVEQSLPLTKGEAEKFWPVYEQLQKDLSAITARRRAIIAEFGENYDDMSDAAARKLMIERLDLEEARLKLLKAYLPRFEKVLPARKLARYFQIEGKIAASVEAGIAEELPLIK